MEVRSKCDRKKSRKTNPPSFWYCVSALWLLFQYFAVKASIDKVKDNMGPGDVADVAEEKAVDGDRTGNLRQCGGQPRKRK